MNCLIGQSGGPSSVINASLAGVIQASIDNNFDKIYVLRHGIEGLLSDNIVEIDKEKYKSNLTNERLKSRPSSILGSCRYKLPNDLDSPIYEDIFNKLKKLGITSFIYIGGNDSMDTVKKLNEYIEYKNIDFVNINGCPKTIDNDLMLMDHSPGFGSAAKYIANTIIDIRTDVDIYDINTVTFVEIIGRNAGWLAASTLITNLHQDRDIVNLLYLSEKPVSRGQIIKDIKLALKHEKNLIVVVSEGFMDSENFFKDEVIRSYDIGFNHPIISGISRKLSDFVYKELDIKTKAVELSITQRTNYMISKTDSDEAFELGYKALSLSLNNTNLVPILIRTNDNPYEVEYSHAYSYGIANKEKLIPKEWLLNENIFKEKIYNYIFPLIQGEINPIIKNGLHSYIKLNEFIK